MIGVRLPLVFPVHPWTRAALEASEAVPGLVLIPPATYLDFIALQDAAALVLTDSGGVQEETTMLGVPCLTLRESTERPITVDQGSNTVVGTSGRIIQHAESVLDAGRQVYPRPPMWDGHAAARVSAVLRTLDDGFPHPTDIAPSTS